LASALRLLKEAGLGSVGDMTRVQRVMLVDDHPVVRSGLALLLDHLEGFSVCGEAATASEALVVADKLQPDLIVLDLFLGGADGLGLIAELRAVAGASRILVYSAQDEERYARRALLAGAQGYVMKREDFATVRRALETLAAGKRHVSEAVTEQLLAVALAGGESDDPLAALSDRELQVLRLIADGRELGEMAQALGLSVKTIGTYRERLKNKLGAATSRELARKASTLLSEEKAPS
jgi:DNA-binding NarL/FixJ family response regulator